MHAPSGQNHGATHASTVCVIAVYFGPLPSYFPLTLGSMGKNPTIDFVLITDQDVGACPPNVTVVLTSLNRIRSQFEEFYGFSVALGRAYKICDFRPAFGELFSDLIGQRDYWGHCDLDVVFGDIRSSLGAETLTWAEKVLIRGNFSLYRNSATVNALYRQSHVGSPSFIDVFSDGEPFYFDEWKGIYPRVLASGVKLWNEDVIFDIDPRRFALREASRTARYRYLWDDGTLVAIPDTNRGGEVAREGLLIHLQKRRVPYLGPAQVSGGRFAIGESAITELATAHSQEGRGGSQRLSRAVRHYTTRAQRFRRARLKVFRALINDRRVR